MLTPSHNPPEDGGYKYNPPSGGPAGTDITKGIEAEANELLEAADRDLPSAAGTTPHDYVSAYVDDLANVIDIDAIRAAGRAHRRRSAGGASVAYFKATAGRHGLNLEWSTRRSTRPSASCRSTTTARSAWTARRRT